MGGCRCYIDKYQVPKFTYDLEMILTTLKANQIYNANMKQIQRKLKDSTQPQIPLSTLL